jgi:hypothetical protein
MPLESATDERSLIRTYARLLILDSRIQDENGQFSDALLFM